MKRGVIREGQTVIAKEIRDQLHWQAGTQLVKSRILRSSGRAIWLLKLQHPHHPQQTLLYLRHFLYGQGYQRAFAEADAV